MNALTVEGIHVRLGGTPVLNGVSLEVGDGAFGAIVGPSGCGKSTLLRAIAGLTAPISGRITLGGRILTEARSVVAPERRGVGWVPQEATLFPHLTVWDNVAFGRTGQGAGNLDGRRRPPRDLDELLRLTGLTGLADRYPEQLSGGQAQRVALARALAAQPALLLLDEPFAALDPQLRGELREDVRTLLTRLGVTGLLVTHDQSEALLVADSVIVLREGRVEQQGVPEEVYQRPDSPWVASFVGEAVFVEAHASGRFAETLLGRMDITPEMTGPVTIMVRPEQFELDPDHTRGLHAVVARVRYGGHDALIELELESGARLLARVPAGRIPRAGDSTRVCLSGQGVAFPGSGPTAAPTAARRG